MGLSRRARKHTAGTQADLWHDFEAGARVKTVEGLLGTVTAVYDGFGAGAETYEVSLDNGMGGGEYSSGELTALTSISSTASKTAACANRPRPPEGTFPVGATETCQSCGKPIVQVVEGRWKHQVDYEPPTREADFGAFASKTEAGEKHVASDDYPELAEILVERPPLVHSIEASRKTASNEGIYCPNCYRTDIESTDETHHQCRYCRYAWADSNSFFGSAHEGMAAYAPENAVPLPEPKRVRTTRAFTVEQGWGIYMHSQEAEKLSIPAGTEGVAKLVAPDGRYWVEFGDTDFISGEGRQGSNALMLSPSSFEWLDGAPEVSAPSGGRQPCPLGGERLWSSAVKEFDPDFGNKNSNKFNFTCPACGADVKQTRQGTISKHNLRPGQTVGSLADEVKQKAYEVGANAVGLALEVIKPITRDRTSPDQPIERASKLNGFALVDASLVEAESDPPRCECCGRPNPATHSNDPYTECCNESVVRNDDNDEEVYARAKADWEQATHHEALGPKEWLIKEVGDEMRAPFNPANNWSYDWCRFRKNQRCMFPKELDAEASKRAGYAVWKAEDRGFCPRNAWEDQKACPVSEPGPHSGDPNALAQVGSKTAEIKQYDPKTGPSDEEKDENYRIMFGKEPPPRKKVASIRTEGSWAEVREKATKIRHEGGVHIVSRPTQSTPYIVADVKGAHATYRTQIMRAVGGKAVAMWECTCPWNTYSWARSGRWKKFEGRMCSHALATVYEAQAREMFGGTITEDDGRPQWDPLPAPAQKVASGGPITVKVNNAFRKVMDFLSGGRIKLDDGREVDADQAIYPSYDPILGLNFHGSVTAGAEELLAGGAGEEMGGGGEMGMPSGPTGMDGGGGGGSPLDSVVDQGNQEAADFDQNDAEIKTIQQYSQPAIQGFNASRTAASDSADMDGIMVAIRPPDEICSMLAKEGGEPITNMHVTLAYLGKAADIDIERVRAAVEELLQKDYELRGHVGGFGVFQNGEANVLYAAVDIPGLAELVTDLYAMLDEYGVPAKQDHGFTPHMTIEYFDPGTIPQVPELPEEAKADFDVSVLYVAAGTQWERYALTSPSFIVDYSGSVGIEADLHLQPEPALPSTDGAEEDEDVHREPEGLEPTMASDDHPLPEVAASLAYLMDGSPDGGAAPESDSDIAQAAQAFLAKEGVKKFSPAEQAALIDEGMDVQASNLDRLDITGTHYEALEAALADEETDTSWLY